jgi:hypothetical protein
MQESTPRNISFQLKIEIAGWIATIAVFLGCFGCLFYKIERQSERADDLYRQVLEISRSLHQLSLDLHGRVSVLEEKTKGM